MRQGPEKADAVSPEPLGGAVFSVEELLRSAGASELPATDFSEAATYLKGKRVLVTGAGGSVGSQLCQQIAGCQCAQLTMLDRDETALQEADIALGGTGLLRDNAFVLADIRDFAALTEVFEERRPDVVFHAAALKHLPLLERYPDEAWKTNVVGTLNVLQAALDVGVASFVHVSTDKAANPTSVLGLAKNLGERLTAWAAQQSGKRYLSVRFGNVLGSQGSVVPTFARLIEQGRNIAVTDPEATRYFMTVEQACQLILQAGQDGPPGEILTLDIGAPVRIIDLAQAMIERSGNDVAIEVAGLRGGEKLHEEPPSKSKGKAGVRASTGQAAVPVLAPADATHTKWEQLVAASAPDRQLKLAELYGSL